MRHLTTRPQGLIAINIAAIIFGSAALFGKLDLSPFWIVGMRAAFAALALFLFALLKRDLGVPGRHQWPIMIGTGAILAIHWLTFFASVQISGVAVATLTFAAFPLFTVLIEAIRDKRNPYAADIGASLMIIIAVALLAHPQGQSVPILGVGAGISSAFTFALFGQVSKRLGQTLSPLHISLAQNGVVALLLMPILFVVGHGPTQTSDWLWLAFLGVITTALMHQLYFYALRRLSAATCGGFIALEPVYAIAFAALLFHEPITFEVIFSAFLIIGASLIFLKVELCS